MSCPLSKGSGTKVLLVLVDYTPPSSHLRRGLPSPYATYPGFRFSCLVRGVWPHFSLSPCIIISSSATFYVVRSPDSASRHAFLPHRTQRDRHTGTNISQAKLTHLFPPRKCDRGPSPVTEARPLHTVNTSSCLWGMDTLPLGHMSLVNYPSAAFS